MYFNKATIKMPKHFIKDYIALTRIQKPTGLFLLMLPVLWALVIAGSGIIYLKYLTIFMCGTIVMRTLGCIINDLVDKDIDRYVARTASRPITSGKISPKSAIKCILFLTCIAVFLAIQLPLLCWAIAIFGMIITLLYPYAKRYIHCPQIVLSIAFSISILMVFAAIEHTISTQAIILFFIACIWPLIYDTQYAISDKQDDLLIGVKSSAIWFGKATNSIILMLQIIFILFWGLFAMKLQYNLIFYICLFCLCINTYYQQVLIQNGCPKKCQTAFKSHTVSGLIILGGITCQYLPLSISYTIPI